MTKNAGHGDLADKRPPAEDKETRALEARNEDIGSAAGMGREEPRDVQKAGGGTKGASLGAANTGRYGPSPENATSNRERKRRGEDKE